MSMFAWRSVIAATLLGALLASTPPAMADFNQKFPGRGSVDAWHAAGAITRQAFAAEDRRDLKAAEALYRKAIQVYPYDAQAYFNLGLFLDRGKRYKEAEPVLRKSIELQPGFQNWQELGISLAHLDRVEAARRAFEGAEKYAQNDKEREAIKRSNQILRDLRTESKRK